jgi:hypothetical protein
MIRFFNDVQALDDRRLPFPEFSPSMRFTESRQTSTGEVQNPTTIADP